MTASALVVDDDRLLLRLIELNLGKTGIDVLLAESGREAIRLALEKKPDIILLDIMMPMMDGYEVMRRLKAAHETRDIPVVMLTAKSNPADQRKCEEMGAVAYITKPFNLERLRGTVRRIIREASEPLPPAD
ncbi:MAG: response regulator [Actinobacteria bacterium]|jgi:CheY-like chemotaxis protein|nr:MAG: response regulator [Actinomycetota bacterium]